MTKHYHLTLALTLIGSLFSGAARGQTGKDNANREVLEFQADKLFYEFVANPVRGNLKFEGKTLKIIGGKITAPIQEKQLTVSFMFDNNAWGLTYLCHFDKSARKTVAALAFDQKVTVTGRLREESGSSN